MEILKVENLNFTYPGCVKKALDGISFSASRGDFVTLCGSTGSGKSTLMRLLKPELTPLGKSDGKICFNGLPLKDLSQTASAEKIGYVMQCPEQQLVTDKVWHELAFGLESLGLPGAVIRRRVAEMASYFGIESWFDKDVSLLSGGQKQLLNLASVMVMQPEILLLDEPTAQLDPIAAADFIDTVLRLNKELSLTVIISEHRTENVIPVSDKLLILKNGAVSAFGETRAVISSLPDDSALLANMPAAVRLFHTLGIKEGVCPLTVREGRDFIENNYQNTVKAALKEEPPRNAQSPALEFRDVFFRYSRELPDVLNGLSFEAYENEFLCVLGGNGAGKSTMLSLAACLKKPYSGKVKVFGKSAAEYKNHSLYKDCLAFLPQDVQTVFLKNTVREELEDTKDFPFDLSELYERHPYDLSGGEQQLVALAKALSQNPRLLLLDEPTKGLDASAKAILAGILAQLKKSGLTVVAVTHDIEFAASYADRCALFFRGEIVSADTPRRFFAQNGFYTTAINRMTRGYFDLAVTVEDAKALCLANGVKKL